jgi:hypothetical protein
MHTRTPKREVGAVVRTAGYVVIEHQYQPCFTLEKAVAVARFGIVQ